MRPLLFSFIVPVYNRPEEIDELLESFTHLTGDSNFEIVLVEDGSDLDCKSVVDKYNLLLDIVYFYKQNSGPGDSRNFGIQRAKGNYFIILDSDCLLPSNYLQIVTLYLRQHYVDSFGGPDAAHDSFTNLQKAVNFAMTSFISTGGIRGGKKQYKDFQPRSFNMGISKPAFEATNGFGNIHPGEDPDLALRVKKKGFETVLIHEAFVYHKRRVSWSKFYEQVYKFGLARPILNQWHPESKKLIYWLPTLFSIGLVLSIALLMFQFVWLVIVYMLYFLVIFVAAIFKTKDFLVSIYAVVAILIQFTGYGYGFLKSTLKLKLSDKLPEQQFPKLFFKNGK